MVYLYYLGLEGQAMDTLYKVYLLLIAGTVGLTIDVLLELLLFQIQPSPILTGSLPINWIIMIRTNPVWHTLWEKWTKK
jgi:hypothetical protein